MLDAQSGGMKSFFKQSPLYKFYFLVRYSSKEALHRFRVKREAKRFRREAMGALERQGLTELKWLGTGKDGVVCLARSKKDQKDYVVKYLSSYGHQYLPVVEDLIRRGIFEETKGFFPISLDENKNLFYPKQLLHHAQFSSVKDFFHAFLPVCELQKSLLREGLILWDFGFSAPNYMLTEKDHFAWADYGGNGFLYLSAQEAPMRPTRENLIIAKDDFVSLSLLFHTILFGLGTPNIRSLMSSLQKTKTFEEFYERAQTYLGGTALEDFYQLVKGLNLLKCEAWDKIAEYMQNFNMEKGSEVLDPADIASVHFDEKSKSVEVRGYQNYFLSRKEIRPFNSGHEWAASLQKWQIVDSLLSEVEGQTYLDIGCNLGLYVFTACVKHGMQASGVDYGQDYIKRCQDVAYFLELPCHFSTGNFAALEERYDCVSALGIIHHLYHRTESYASLAPIVEKFAQLTKRSFIVEFPTENDVKAAKWTQMPARKILAPYSEKEFLRCVEQSFSSYKKVKGVIKERPIYLLKK